MWATFDTCQGIERCFTNRFNLDGLNATSGLLYPDKGATNGCESGCGEVPSGECTACSSADPTMAWASP
eukprot:COSAG01_NODE_57284_length_313_cov_0.752336_1_plen_68_part_01